MLRRLRDLNPVVGFGLATMLIILSLGVSIATLDWSYKLIAEVSSD